MKQELNWSAMLDDKLTDEDMNKIRGADGEMDPNEPIVK